MMIIDAKQKKRVMTAASVFAIALGTGFLMQNLGPMADQFADRQAEKSEAAATKASLQPLSSALQQSSPAPKQMDSQAQALAAPVRMASVVPSISPMSLAPDSLPAADGVASACALKLKATAQEAALVQLTLTAPCNGGQPVTVKHGPLSFTDITADDGTFTVTVPALSATAAFEARFDSGERAFAMTLVEGLDDHRRVALTWQGNIGLALHALENGAEYDTGGHISAAHPATASRALSGEGGFLTVLGSADLPGARIAEVYSYPAALEGEVQLNVEAAVTEATCGAEMSANILSLGIKGYASHALTATMPGCDAVGEHLMFFDVQPEVRLASAE